MVLEPVKPVFVMWNSKCGLAGFSRSSVKLWKSDLSLTAILYVPAFRVLPLTDLPAFLSEIVNPGPTTPLSVVVLEL